jgi:hypothetical protein
MLKTKLIDKYLFQARQYELVKFQQKELESTIKIFNEQTEFLITTLNGVCFPEIFFEKNNHLFFLSLGTITDKNYFSYKEKEIKKIMIGDTTKNKLKYSEFFDHKLLNSLLKNEQIKTLLSIYQEINLNRKLVKLETESNFKRGRECFILTQTLINYLKSKSK